MSSQPQAAGLGKLVRRVLLIDWLGNQISSLCLSAVLSAKLHSWAHVKLKADDIGDAFKGNFESFEVSCRGGKYKGMALGAVHVQSERPVQIFYRTKSGHRRGFKAPLLVSMEGTMAERDLSRALQSKTVTSNLRFLKFNLPGLGDQHLQVIDPRVALADDFVDLRCRMITAGADPSTAVNVRIKALPQLDRQRYVRLNDIKVQSADIEDPVHFGPFLETLFNPLIDFGRFDRFTHAFRLSQLQIKDGKVHYAGKLWLVPRQDEKTGYSAAFLMAHPEVDPTIKHK